MNEKIEELYKTMNGHEISYFEFIGELTKQEQPKRILEVGSGWAMSSVSFMLNSEATMISIDKNPLSTLDLFKSRIDMFGLWDRIEFIQGDSKTVLPTIDERFDIVYIDGDHTYKGCKGDIELAWQMVSEGGVLLFDDVFHYLNWESRNPKEITEFGVTRAVCEFCKWRGKDVNIIARANGFGVIRL